MESPSVQPEVSADSRNSSFEDGLSSSLNNNINGIISFLETSNDKDNVPVCDDIPNTQPVVILKDVKAYVEVRAEYENRSRAVEKQLKQLGAEISNKVEPGVTHVIFKGGRKNTIKKAKKLGIQLVSVLWVESCKRNEERMPEHLYPAVLPDGEKNTPNLLIGRLKKTKSMQPKDFDEEIANSADRAKKRRERQSKAKNWKLFDVSSSEDNSPTVSKPYNRKVLVAETQPRTPDGDSANENNITIPDTPSSMKEALDRMKSFRRRLHDPDYSPHSSSDEDILAKLRAGQNLQRKLFDAEVDTSCATPHASTTIEMASISECPEASDNVDTSVSVSDHTISSVFSPGTPPKSAVSMLRSRDRNLTDQQAEEISSSPGITGSKDNRRRSGRLKPLHEVTKITPKSNTGNSSTDLRKIAIQQDSNRKLKAAAPVLSAKRSARRSIVPPSLPVVNEVETTSESAENDSHKVKVKKRKLMVLDSQPQADLLIPSKSTNAAQEKPKVFSPIQKRKRGRPTSDKSSEGEPSVKPANKVRRRSERLQTPVLDLQTTESRSQESTPPKDARIVSDSPLQTPTACSNIDKTNKPRRQSVLNGSVQNNTPKSGAKRRKSTAVLPCDSPGIPTPPVHLPDIETQDLFSDNISSSCNKVGKSRRRSVPVGNWLSDEKWGLSPEEDKTKPALATDSRLTTNNTAHNIDTILSSQNATIEGHSTAYPVLQITSSNTTLMNLTRSRKSVADFQVEKKTTVSSKSQGQIEKSKNVKLTKGSRAKTKSKDPSSSSSSEDSVCSSSDQKKRKSKAVSPSICLTDGKVECTIVTTSLHTEEQETVRAVVQKLGGFKFAHDVTSSTSHLVCGSNRRTLNILRALARGCWIISLEWVLLSLEAGKWLTEDKYELTKYFPSGKKYRMARFASTGVYKSELFRSQGKIYIADKCSPSSDELASLVTLCGGTVTRCARQATVCVGRRSKTAAKCVTEQWILDSITSNKLVLKEKYPIPSDRA